MRTIGLIFLFVCIAAFTPENRLNARTGLELALVENMFSVNEETKFLVFVSYFDAMHVSSGNLHSDFAYLKGKGVDGVRIFPNWMR